MDFLLLAAFKHIVLGFSLFFISFFLIFIVLIQRGRGGGLSGALGGTGQSAFGSRAGDEMTYITLIVSAIWIFLCVLCIWVLNPMDSDRLLKDKGDIQPVSDDDPTGLNTRTGVPPASTSDEDPPSTEPAAEVTPDSPAADDTPPTEPAADVTPDSPAADDTPSTTEPTGSDGLDDPGTNPTEQPAPKEPTGDKPDPVEPGSGPESPAQP
jgi:preprotein translocase subunit SecG